jgi:hypothetical protein
MRQDQITLGMQARVKIGSRLAEVRVLRRLDGRGRARFECMTQDTGRTIKATAARLRPMVEARRQPAAPAAAPEPAAWDGPVGDRWLPAVPVPGLLSRGTRRVLQLSPANAAGVCRIVDREHVAEGMMRIARVVRASIGRSVRWQTIPRDLRRGVLFAAACRHHTNRETYRAVMGHDPLPSPRAVAEAVGIAVGLGPMPV